MIRFRLIIKIVDNVTRLLYYILYIYILYISIDLEKYPLFTENYDINSRSVFGAIRGSKVFNRNLGPLIMYE